MNTDEVVDNLNNLSLEKSSSEAEKSKAKPKPGYDKAALKERWKILGSDPEQSNVFFFDQNAKQKVTEQQKVFCR